MGRPLPTQDFCAERHLKWLIDAAALMRIVRAAASQCSVPLILARAAAQASQRCRLKQKTSVILKLILRLQELKQCLGSGSLGTMWLGVWQETEVAARVLSKITSFVAPENILSVMETEVRSLFSPLQHSRTIMHTHCCTASHCLHCTMLST